MLLDQMEVGIINAVKKVYNSYFPGIYLLQRYRFLFYETLLSHNNNNVCMSRKKATFYYVRKYFSYKYHDKDSWVFLQKKKSSVHVEKAFSFFLFFYLTAFVCICLIVAHGPILIPYHCVAMPHIPRIKDYE